MLVDGDCFYTVDIAGMFREVCTTHNATFCFNDTQPKPLYSYVTLKAGTNDVLDIKEKIKISDNANTGCYCFKSGTELAAYCEKIIEAGTMQLSQDQKVWCAAASEIAGAVRLVRTSHRACPCARPCQNAEPVAMTKCARNLVRIG